MIIIYLNKSITSLTKATFFWPVLKPSEFLFNNEINLLG